MRRALLVTVVGLAVVAASGAGGGVAAPGTTGGPTDLAAAPQLTQLLGFAEGRLARVDSGTLRPSGGIPVGSGGCATGGGGTACWTYPAWTVAPDGARLAIARNDASRLQVVDAGRLRVTASMRVEGGAIGALAWLVPGRVLALQEIAGEQQQLLVVDLAAMRVLERRPLRGSVRALERTAQELVMLLAPAQKIGPARIAVAGRRGAVRFVQLPRILAGSKLLGTGARHRVDARGPDLAVDPQRRRAFVVDRSLVAEVDLRTLEVSYHSLSRPASLLSRIWNWLEPVAQAKQVSGHHRLARWLGGDLLAVSGTDTERSQTRATGLLFVDTRSWRVRKLDSDASGFELAGDLLLARGAGTGLAAYGFDGEERFRLFAGKNAWPDEIHAGLAYVGLLGQESLQVVDLATGRIVGVRTEPLPRLLDGVGSGWWE